MKVRERKSEGVIEEWMQERSEGEREGLRETSEKARERDARGREREGEKATSD